MPGRLFSRFLPVFLAVFIAVSSLCDHAWARKATRKRPSHSLSAKSAVVMDARTGEILFSRNADERLEPASIAKVMTAMVAADEASLTSKIRVSKAVENVEPTVAGVRPRVKYALGDLVKAILIKSANDAAVAIAVGVAGSERNFAELMNKKARRLGMTNAKFANSSGLPSNGRAVQYISARDAAKMMREASKDRFILSALSRKEDCIRGSDSVRLYLRTHNKSLYSPRHASWGKTGYTDKARRTFVGVDPSSKPRIVIAILKSNNLWNDIAILKKRGLQLYNGRRVSSSRTAGKNGQKRKRSA